MYVAEIKYVLIYLFGESSLFYFIGVSYLNTYLYNMKTFRQCF